MSFAFDFLRLLKEGVRNYTKICKLGCKISADIYWYNFLIHLTSYRNDERTTLQYKNEQEINMKITILSSITIFICSTFQDQRVMD